MISTEPLKIIILGAGGHAQVAADALLQGNRDKNQYQLIGFLDDNPDLHGKTRLGYSILGSLQKLDQIPRDGVFIGIGDNRIREKIYREMILLGENLINILHPSSVISSSTSLGSGVLVCAGVVINTGSVIENNVILNTSCSIDHHNTIHNHVHVAPGVHLGGDVEIGEGAFLGMGSVVTPQKIVGPWSVIGAGASVIRDVPSEDVIAGVPAKPIKETQSD